MKPLGAVSTIQLNDVQIALLATEKEQQINKGQKGEKRTFGVLRTNNNF